MNWWTRIRNRDRIEDVLDAELRDHVERQVTDHIRAGMSAREARRRARLEFGGLDQVKEMCRDARGTRWVEETWQDLRFALRLLFKERWFAAAAVLALGLGIGLASTAFTVYNAVLVRGLPVEDADRIMALGMRGADGGEQGISHLDFQDWRAAATSFEDMAAYSEPPMNVSDAGMATERFFGARVTANTFGLLGIEPLLGRDFAPDDDRLGAPAVVMLGHGIWTNRYGAHPEVLGRVIRVDDALAIVIGVALTLVLLAGAGLMARSLLTLARTDRVIETAGVTTIQLLLPEARYPTAEQRVAFFRTLDEQVEAGPSILSATRAGAIPFAPIAPREFAIDGRPASDGDPPPTAGVMTIADDYFEALGLPLQRGRRVHRPATGPRATAASSSTGALRTCSSRTTTRSANAFA